MIDFINIDSVTIIWIQYFLSYTYLPTDYLMKRFLHVHQYCHCFSLFCIILHIHNIVPHVRYSGRISDFPILPSYICFILSVFSVTLVCLTTSICLNCQSETLLGCFLFFGLFGQFPCLIFFMPHHVILFATYKCCLAYQPWKCFPSYNSVVFFIPHKFLHVILLLPTTNVPGEPYRCFPTYLPI